MKDKDLDKIKESKMLDSVVKIAIDEGVQALKSEEKRNSKKKINKRYKVLAASLAVAVIGGLSFGNETVLASIENIKSMIERAFVKNDGELSDSITNINQSITSNGVTVTLNEAMIDGDELIITLDTDYAKPKASDWKLNKKEKYSFENSQSMERSNSLEEKNYTEGDKLNEIIFNEILNGNKIDLLNVKGIDYTKISEDDLKHLNIFKKQYETMYNWGHSDKDFYDREVDPEEIVEDLIVPFRYSFKVNGKVVEDKGGNYYYDDKRPYYRGITLKLDISEIKDENLVVEIEGEDIKLGGFYPVRKKAKWDFNFKMKNSTKTQGEVFKINKTFEFEDMGTINIKESLVTNARIKIKYNAVTGNDLKDEQAALMFRVKENNGITFLQSNQLPDGTGFIEITNVEGVDTVEVIPEIVYKDGKSEQLEGAKIKIK